VHRLRNLGLSFEEVKGVLGTMFLVGTQTTSVAVPRIVALLLDTGAWTKLLQNPELLPGAVDEGLRSTVPVPITIRSVASDASIGRHRFKSGSRAFIFTYNLARNPRLFRDPGRFDINRRCTEPRAKHLWYGSGPHFCLGFGLAQEEISRVLATLLDIRGELRVARRRYARNVLLPGYSRLDIQVRRR
jgi:cytochrome P450